MSNCRVFTIFDPDLVAIPVVLEGKQIFIKL